MSFKKTISILLSLITILSMFTIATAPVEAASKPTISITKAAFNQGADILTIVKSNKKIQVFTYELTNTKTNKKTTFTVPGNNTKSFVYTIREPEFIINDLDCKLRVKIKDSDNASSDWSNYVHLSMDVSLKTPKIKSAKASKDKTFKITFEKPANAPRIIYKITNIKTKEYHFEHYYNKKATATLESCICCDKGKYKIEMKVLTGSEDEHTILKNMYQSAWSKPVYVTVK